MRLRRPTDDALALAQEPPVDSPADPPRSAAAYTIEPRNRFFEANRSAVEHEIRPGNTVTFLGEVDLTEVERVRSAAPAGRRPSYTAFVARAVALALRDYPYANRRVCGRAWLPLARPRLQAFTRLDVAVAVEREVPGSEATAFLDVLRDADRRSLADLTAHLQTLATCDLTNNAQWRSFHAVITRCPAPLAARLIRLPLYLPGLWPKYRGGAVLISSPAKYGVDAVLGAWMYPLGVSFGLAKPRPVVCDGQVVARPTFTLSFNFDRRVMAGAPAARVFRRIVERLERAETALAGDEAAPAGARSGSGA
jgi:pyruvate/2-oxoglutarate dehydrogenase complex dihydrolipoamide acyltransferase (E2) component